MRLKITRGSQTYTYSEIMAESYPELWKRAQGQVDRLAELQEKLLDRFKDFQKPMTDAEAYIYFRSVFAFAHELWYVFRTKVGH